MSTTETVTQTAPVIEKTEALATTLVTEEPSNRIYVGNLPADVTSDKIKTFLSGFNV